MLKKTGQLAVLGCILFLIHAETSMAGSLITSIIGPRSYDECITESMKGISNDVAVKQVAQSCRNMFPSEDQKDEELKIKNSRLLTHEELSKVSGNMKFIKNNDLTGELDGMITNKNKKTIITRLKIVVKFNDTEYTETYNVKTLVKPIGQTYVGFVVLLNDTKISNSNPEFSWSIVGGEGYNDNPFHIE